MDAANVINIVTAITQLLSALDIDKHLRYKIANAVAEGRDLTEAELDELIDSAQSAIDKARED